MSELPHGLNFIVISPWVGCQKAVRIPWVALGRGGGLGIHTDVVYNNIGKDELWLHVLWLYRIETKIAILLIINYSLTPSSEQNRWHLFWKKKKDVQQILVNQPAARPNFLSGSKSYYKCIFTGIYCRHWTLIELSVLTIRVMIMMNQWWMSDLSQLRAQPLTPHISNSDLMTVFRPALLDL